MGGNVFKVAGVSATGRINKADVIPTVKWLEKLTGLHLVNNMLGSTGYKDTSGDIDLAIDDTQLTKDQLVTRLLAQNISKADIKKSGDSVHLKTPINGIIKNGYAQCDFMFGDVQWQKFSMMGSPVNSKYKGMHRHLLLASIAKAQGMKWSYKNGLVDRETNNIISKDPETIAKLLVNGTVSDLQSVESILAKIKLFSNYSSLINDAKDTLELN